MSFITKRRAIPSKKEIIVTKVECLKCSSPRLKKTWTFCPHCGSILSKEYIDELERKRRVTKNVLARTSIDNVTWHLVKKDETYQEWFQRVVTKTYGYAKGTFSRDRLYEDYSNGGFSVYYLTDYMIDLDYPEMRDKQIYYNRKNGIK